MICIFSWEVGMKICNDRIKCTKSYKHFLMMSSTLPGSSTFYRLTHFYVNPLYLCWSIDLALHSPLLFQKSVIFLVLFVSPLIIFIFFYSNGILFNHSMPEFCLHLFVGIAALKSYLLLHRCFQWKDWYTPNKLNIYKKTINRKSIFIK